MSSDFTPSSKRTLGDHAIAAVRAATSTIPIIGGPATEALAYLLQPPIEKRREEWCEKVGATLNALTAKGHTFESLQNDPRFIDTVIATSRIAIQTSDPVKLAALNALIENSATIDVDEAELAMFISLVDRFHGWHLRLLGLLNDPKEWFRRRSRAVPERAIAYSVAQLIENAFPELLPRSSFVLQLGHELHQAGLLKHDKFQLTMSGTGPLEPNATGFGQKFLKYISSSSTNKPSDA